MPILKIKEKKIKPVVEGTQMQTSTAIVSKYKKRLKAITTLMTQETNKKITDFFKKAFVKKSFEKQAELNKGEKIEVMDEKSPASQIRILLGKIRKKYTRLIEEKGEEYAQEMLSEVNLNSKLRAQLSLEKLSGVNVDLNLTPPSITEELKAYLAWNVSLIRDIPNKYFTQIQQVVTQSLSSGGVFDIKKELLKYEKMTEKRATRIAEDQTRKAFNNLNEQRFKSVGVNKFKWNHSSAGQTPRPLHLNVLDGQVFSFDNLPIIDDRTGERGIPGQLPNCRCFMTPVIEFTEEEIKNAA